MEWSWLDLDSWTVRPSSEFSKIKSLVLPLEGALCEIIKRRIKLREPPCPYVFHRKGKPIKSFRKAFKAAAKAAALAGFVSHDMRRSAVMNFRKAGYPKTNV